MSVLPTTGARDNEPIPWGWLVSLTAMAIVVRAIGLNSQLWLDEVLTLQQSVRVPLGQIVTAFPGNNQHTLFSVLAHLSVGLFGEHPWSVRLPAMIFGAATVPILYLFAQELAGRTEALLASFLLAVAYHHVWFSQNARGYTLTAFFTLLSSWLLLRGLRRRQTGDFVWYGIASALNVYAHLTMVFVVLTQALLCLLPLGLPGLDPVRRARWRQPATGFMVAGVLTLGLYAPLLLDLQQFVDRDRHPEVATPAWAVMELLRGLHLGAGAWSVGLVGAGLALLGLWSYFRQSPFVTGLFTLPGIVTVAGAIVLNHPIFPRFLFFLIGFAILIVVRGAFETGRILGRRRGTQTTSAPAAGMVLVSAMAMASLVALVPNYRYPKQDFAGALRFVETHQTDGEPVVTIGALDVYQRYYQRPFGTVVSAEELQRFRAQGRRVWVLHTSDENVGVEAPELMRLLVNDCAVEQVFRGTLSHGEVTVCTALPIAATQDSRPGDRAQ